MAEWHRLIDYGAVRVRQAVEFRDATQGQTLLTSPLTFCYALLNLVRGVLAFKFERESRPAHGLVFTKGATLLDCSATVQGGTFGDYLDALGVRDEAPGSMSLHDALIRIPELAADYMYAYDRLGDVVGVGVEAYYDGEVAFNFSESHLPRFREQWEEDFPQLTERMTLAETGARLSAKLEGDDKGHERVSRFCHDVLVPDLRWLENDRRWWAIRQLNRPPALPREIYYYVAIFILGILVRYEPSLLLSLSSDDSRLAWLLERFLSLTERYFPQLMLERLHERPIYFSSA